MGVYDYYITPSDYERADKNGVSRNRLETRVRKKGWSKERAIITPPRELNDRSKWAEIARQNGIKYNTFASRINALGWSEEKAATTKVEKYRDGKGKRKYPKKYIELAAKNGIGYHTFQKRVHLMRWSMERAATEPVWTQSQIADKTKKIWG